MAEKVETALNETRILVLVVQVLIGFQFEAVFTKGFERLPAVGQVLLLIGLALQIAALALLLEPSAYHRLVDRGLLSRYLCVLTTNVVGAALVLMASALALQFAIVAAPVVGTTAAGAGGAGLGVVALFFWWGLELLNKPAGRHVQSCAPNGKQDHRTEANMKEESPLPEKMKFALTETRVVLPGAQALLGFQFICILSEPFSDMPASLKLLHLLSLAAIAVTAILLMAPAAYHRIVERGESTERVLQFTNNMLLAAMAFLAIGLAGDVYVVVAKVIKSANWAAFGAAATMAACYGLWFGYTLLVRSQAASGEIRQIPAQ